MDQGVWVLGEERNGQLHPVSYEMLAWGRSLADALAVPLTCVLVCASSPDAIGELISRGADVVRVARHPQLARFAVEPFLHIVARLIKSHRPEILLASATTLGRTLMPVLAAKLHAGLTADCTGLEIDIENRLLIQTRPAIGGNVMAMIKTPEHRPQMATVRPRSRHPLPRDASRSGEAFEEAVVPEDLFSRTSCLRFEPDETSDIPIQEADVLVAGGRGMKDAKTFHRLFDLARCLGGAVGASRAAVDQGWIPYSHQVGLSGKSVTPQLYLAFGISGSANHLAGMSGSEAVVAINKDPDADIHRLADLAIVGDVAEVLPALIERLERRGTHGHSGEVPS